MARGGGFSGGARGGGGSFGGSRGGGGRIGGGFNVGRGGGSFSGGFGFPSGGSSFGSSSFGGSFLGGFLGSRIGRRPSGGDSGGGPPGGGTPTGCGCGTFLAAAVIIILLITVFYIFSSGAGTGGSGDTDITKSTIEREPLPAGAAVETGFYTDESGWIFNEGELLEGLEYFYRETGVHPYVYITDTVNGSNFPSYDQLEEFANGLYDDLFSDEAHLLLVFFEYTPEQYMDYYVTGTQAKTVIDSEAGTVLLDYLDRYYYDSGLTDEGYFSKSFADTADRIMEVTRSPWIPMLVVLGIIVLVIILFSWWMRVKKQKNLEAQQTEDILNSPIEKFGDTEAENLAKKYDDLDKDNN